MKDDAFLRMIVIQSFIFFLDPHPVSLKRIPNLEKSEEEEESNARDSSRVKCRSAAAPLKRGVGGGRRKRMAGALI